MSLFEDIKSLEKRIQKEIARAANYKSISNYVEVYRRSIINSISSFSQADINDANIMNIISQALSDSTDFINIDLVDEINNGIFNTIEETQLFYEDLGIQPVDLFEGIQRRKEIEKITDEFNINMQSMREELRDGTLKKIKEVIGKEGLNRERLAEEIFQFADGRAQWARTNARMVVSSSNRLARDEVRQSANLQYGFYYGSVRTNTRAFCRQCAGQTFTINQINNMSNGQGLDVKIYAGGWNCIHSWLWVDPEWDQELQNTLESNRPIVELTEDSLDLSVPQ